MARSPRGSTRIGRLVLAVVGVVTLAIATLMTVAALQNRATAPRAVAQGLDLPDSTLGDPGGPRGRIVLDTVVAQLTVVPGEAGTRVEVEATYDPDDYALQQELDGDGRAPWTLRLGLRPRGSPTWALFRTKLGGRAPLLRVVVPRDVRLDLEGSIDRGFAALELGGLWIDSARLDIGSAGAALSFAEPLREPMESLDVRAGAGSLQITSLGNASPRTAALEQSFGALALDLRGAWARDASIRIDARVAGGSLWLPDDVAVIGLGGHTRPGPVAPEAELDRPTLDFSLSTRVDGLVVVE